MSAHKLLVVGMLGAWLCGGLIPGAVASAELVAPVHQAAGEIVWLDTQLGRIQLHEVDAQGTQAIAAYNITAHETQVTDRLDQQFLAITDLRAGQHITIESRDSGEARIATKIVVEPSSTPLFQQAEGTIESIDVNPGTFTLRETASPGAASVVSSFMFDPRDIVVMEHPSLQPVRLEVMPGDFVQVGYMMHGDRRHARSMMRYGAVPASTTTTTITTSSTTTRP